MARDAPRHDHMSDRRPSLFHDARVVAGKDLRIEARSKVTTSQVAPFAVLMLVLFAFALDSLVVRDPSQADAVTADAKAAIARAAGAGVLRTSIGDIAASVVSSGLFWLAVLFAALLAVQRSFAIETADGGREGLRMSSLDPAGIFLGKAAAIAVQLLVLEVILGIGVVILYQAELRSPLVLLLTCGLATIGLASVGTAYGALAAGLRVRETLLPLLYFPVVAPMILAAVKATEAALTGAVGEAWPWVRLLAVFAVVFSAVGVLTFGTLLEDS